MCFIADPAITELCDSVCSNLQKRLADRARQLG
jgi:hypothetical protein